MLSEKEIVEVVSTFNAMNDANYNCEKCKKRMAESARDSVKGCRTINEKPVAQWRKEITYKTCPVNFYNRGISVFVDMFGQFERGVLPYSGGLMDQPNKIIELFSLIESLKIETEIDRLERQKAQAKRNQGRWQK